MFWITKYRHNKIVEQYEEALQVQKENLNRKQAFERITEKLTDITERLTDKFDGITANLDDCISAGELILPNDVPRYVPDYYGGKVIKQEATKVVSIDSDGNATYHWTATKPPKGRTFIVDIL